MPDIKPEALLEMWRRATQELPLPYKTSDDVVLNVIAPGSDYKYADQIPNLQPAPRFPAQVQVVVDDLLKRKVIERSFHGVADGIAKICAVDHVDRDGWSRVTAGVSNYLCVLFDPREMKYAARTNRLLLAPVQVTVGQSMILAVRGFVSLLAPDRVNLFDIRFVQRGGVTYENHKWAAPDHDSGTLNERICAAAENILRGQGVVKAMSI